MADFDEAFGALEGHFGDFDVIFDGFIEGTRDDFALDRAAHVGDFFGALANQQHHQMNVGMVDGDTIGDGFEQQSFAGLGGRYNQTTLATTHGCHQIDKARR